MPEPINQEPPENQNPPEPQPEIKAVDENGVPYFNHFKEAQRKQEELEQENSRLREQQLRFMAQPPQQQPNPFYYATSNTQPVQQPEEEDFNQQFQTDPERAVRGVVRKKIVPEMTPEFQKIAEDVARKTYYRETMKQVAATRYPDLRNPQSDFFKKVAFFMETHPEKYQEAEGILDACARVQSEIVAVQPSAASQKANQVVRQNISAASAQVEGASTAPASSGDELDPKAKEFALKLGIDPKNMAARLKNMMDGKEEYAPAEGKTGKAQLR